VPTTTYRPMSPADIPAAHALSLEVKWPHRADDWRFVLAAGEGIIAEEAEKTLGTALYWKYGKDTGSLGMVIVTPEAQGRGIGRTLMEKLLAALGDRTTILHATPAGEPLYAKLGFERIGAIHQHQSANFTAPAIATEPKERIREIEPVDTPKLIDLASRASGLDRSALLPALMQHAKGIAIETDNELTGFALIREFGRGHAIGPVVTLSVNDDHKRRAKALITHLLEKNKGNFTRIDTPDENGLSPWLESLGLVRVDTVIKMSRNGTPPKDTSVAQFAIVNQALG
jgi:GNAT superfamily N-acetyltransferase